MTQVINPGIKLFSHLDRLHEIKMGGRPAPVNVEVDLSNRCSRGCYFCHFAYTHTRGPLKGKRDKPQDAILGGDLMEWDLAVSMIDQLKAYGVRSMTLTGGGEPTLHPRFNDVVEYVAGAGLELGLYTLGGHIDAERADLIKKNLTWVYVSLDACTRESYQETKGMDGFQPVIEGIKRLVAASGDATVGVGFLLHRDNWRSTHAMVKLGKSLGVDYVQFRPTVHFEMDAPGALAENTSWVTGALAHLGAYQHDPFVIADVDRFKRYQKWGSHQYKTCFWSAMQTVITPNGKVWRCTNKREHPGALLGDLSVESFSDVWQRSGGPCAVDSSCRIACRGDLANVTLNAVMAPQAHSNFV